MLTAINNISVSPNLDKPKPLQYGEIPTTCPCCNNTVASEAESVGFDYFKGRLFKRGKQIYLEPMEADLLKILLDAWPKICSKEKLFVGLYGGNYSEKTFLVSSDNLGVCMSKLRPKLEIFGIEIKNVRSRGWWLVKSPHESVGKRD